jgi:hypothetical protein
MHLHSRYTESIEAEQAVHEHDRDRTELDRERTPPATAYDRDRGDRDRDRDQCEQGDDDDSADRRNLATSSSMSGAREFRRSREQAERLAVARSHDGKVPAI